ncbi:hypothetical protein LPN04_23120 [Rugamonas sp. A1-17]|nr:hypothetical protein [Rugamonas sp. A1-17]
MNTDEQNRMLAWYEQLMETQRLTFQRAAEGWLVNLDGFPMSYGETQEIAVGWAFIMSHKSAYE